MFWAFKLNIGTKRTVGWYWKYQHGIIDFQHYNSTSTEKKNIFLDYANLR